MMIKCMVIVLIIILVILLLNTYSCENYSGLDNDNLVPCYEAINYNELDKSREYNPDNVNYDNSNKEEGYNFSNENVPLSNSVLPMPSAM
jgi:hypothetical protein